MVNLIKISNYTKEQAVQCTENKCEWDFGHVKHTNNGAHFKILHAYLQFLPLLEIRGKKWDYGLDM